jgi:hypothetical protein
MKTNWSFLKKGVLVISLLFSCGVLLADDPPQPPVVNPIPGTEGLLPPIAGQTGANYSFLVGW